MNIITVKINGVEYSLKGKENEEYLHKIARYVDKKLKYITENNPRLSTTSAAIFTAVNISDELYKEKQENIDNKEKQENVEKENKKLLEEIEALKKQLDQLDKYNQELESKIALLEDDDGIDKKQCLKENIKN
jgi:cell division protein ZapA